ncbi:hypothetical protein H0H93_008240, partial [Arthromyces matolae]
LADRETRFKAIGDNEDRELFLTMMKKMLEWDPEKRYTAKQLLEDDWLKKHAEVTTFSPGITQFPVLKLDTYIQHGFQLDSSTPAPLTCLMLTDFSIRQYDEFFQLLKRCPSLERLAISSAHPIKLWTTLSEKLPSLCHLQSLALGLTILSESKDMGFPLRNALVKITLQCQNTSMQELWLFVTGSMKLGRAIWKGYQDRIHVIPEFPLKVRGRFFRDRSEVRLFDELGWES